MRTTKSLKSLIKKIKSVGFYNWLINENKYEYDGSCPCFYFVIPEYEIELDCSCWRTGGFKFSGLAVSDKKDDYSYSDLKDLTILIMSEITERWSNTDWEYRINDGIDCDYVVD